MGIISLVMPQIGQPDTTEDVKVQNAFTTIQAVINGNIDRSNIAAGIARPLLTSKSANYAAVDGDLVEMTAVSTTVTLPTPTAGVTIGVFAANAGTTGATPVTVTASVGSIASAGTLAATRTLGLPYVGVLLVADGSNWLTVGGSWNTGWLTTTPGTNVITSCQVRVEGDLVRFKASFAFSGTVTAGATVCTLPAAAFPIGSPISFVGTGNAGGTACQYTVSTSGLLTCSANLSAVTPMNGLSYSLT